MKNLKKALLLLVVTFVVLYLIIKDDIPNILESLKKANPLFLIIGIGFAFLLISTLIHNEIIIINHPKLRAKTEYYLGRDADKEQYSSYTNLYSDTFSESNSDSALFDDITGSDN